MLAPATPSRLMAHGRAFSRIAQFHPELTALRRDLHAHPELGFEEVYTAARVQEALRLCGVDEIHQGLGRTGIVNQAITGLGLSDEPLRLLFTETAVFIGLVQLFLPLMVLSLVSALENLPADVIPAARVLGAGWFTVFWRVILPLTREGLVIGGTLVFTGAITAYITPAVLGGSKVLMLETLLYQRVSVANDFVSASVIAVILIVMSVVTHGVLKRAAAARKR